MQAVFTSSYLHSAIIYVAVVLFSVYVYSGSDGRPISSIGEVYGNLKARSAVSSRSHRLPQAQSVVKNLHPRFVNPLMLLVVLWPAQQGWHRRIGFTDHNM